MALSFLEKKALPVVEGLPIKAFVASLLSKGDLPFSEIFSKVSHTGMTANSFKKYVFQPLTKEKFVKPRGIVQNKKFIGYEFRLVRPYIHVNQRFDPPMTPELKQALEEIQQSATEKTVWEKLRNIDRK